MNPGHSAAADLDAGPRDQDAERRQLTVLFCDLVDSTPLSASIDPEEFGEIVRAYQEVTSAVVARFDGHVGRYLGDGVLAYFGYPRAHEDDAQRAVRAGLAMIEGVRRLSARLEAERNIRLDVRIGIHTGLVVTSAIGGTARREWQVLGMTPNVAARLQDLAAANTLLISDATARLVAGFFHLRSRGLRKLRGVPDPMPVHQVLNESTARSRLDVAGSVGLTPFTGRDAEVELLLERWERAKRGRGQVVLLCGEPGIGKSRLVRVLEEHVTVDPAAWLTTCLSSPYYRNTAFHPVIDLIERVVLHFGPHESAARKLRKLEGWLIQHGLSLEETVPLFSSLLSLPLEGRYPPSPLDPDRQKQKIMEALLQILLIRASEQPVLFVLEDLHWVDPSSLELLDRLMSQVASAQMLVIVTYRPEFIPPWREQSSITSLTLNRLGREPSIAMVHWVAGGRTLPQSVLEQVLARTDGVPLFLEELSKAVVESGLLRAAEGRFEMVGALPPLAIPSTLQDSLMARLDRLDAVKAVAQLGATMGREFSYELLRAVSPIREATLRAALDQLVDAELVYQSGQPPAAHYTFKHSLIQETAYQSLLRSTRQQYHVRVAQVLEKSFVATVDTQPELIAHHYTQAGLAEAAIPYWLRAGQRALERAANLEAIAHLERGLELLHTLPRTPTIDAHELELQISLAPAYMAIRGWGSTDVEQTCSRARTLAESMGDIGRQFAALWGLWTNYFLRGKMRETLAIGEQVLQLAGTADAPMFQVMARHAMGYSHFYRGEFESTRRHAEQGLALFDMDLERAIVRSFQFSSSTALRIMLGSSLWMLGYPDQASQLVAAGLNLTLELCHLPSQAFALAASLLLHYYTRNVVQAREISNELLALAQQESFEIWSPFALMFHGWSLVEDGHHAEGILETKRGIAMWQATGSYLNQTIAMAMLGDCLKQVGRRDEALAVVEAELVAAHEREELHFAPELYRLKAEIIAEQAAARMPGDPARVAMLRQAESTGAEALALATRQGARMLELRAAVSLGRVLERAGRSDDARQMLALRCADVPSDLDSAETRAARTLLAQLCQLSSQDGE